MAPYQLEEERRLICLKGGLGVHRGGRPKDIILSSEGWGCRQLLDELHVIVSVDTPLPKWIGSRGVVCAVLADGGMLVMDEARRNVLVCCGTNGERGQDALLFGFGGL